MTPSEPEQRRTACPYFEVEAQVVGHNRIVGIEYEITFEAPQIARAARPGQFVMAHLGTADAPQMRRPFSFYRVDIEAGTFSVLYLARGSFTRELALQQVGDTVGLTGPLGRPFDWQPNLTTRHILVAGGIGAPPVYFLAREICRERSVTAALPAPGCEEVYVINAARNSELLVGMAEFGALNITLRAATEDGGFGRRGLATELLTELLEEAPAASTRLYTCGPTPMLRAVAQIARERGIRCQVSLETPMPCGIGVCGECLVQLHDSHGDRSALTCVEGPVFDADAVRW